MTKNEILKLINAIHKNTLKKVDRFKMVEVVRITVDGKPVNK